MAIQVGGTQVISNSQGLTNITSIDSTTATAIGAAGVGGGGTIEMTADGSISAGDVVGISETGKVKTTAPIFSQEDTVYTHSSSYYFFRPKIAYDQATNKVVMASRDTQSSSLRMRLIVGSVASDGTITWGTSYEWTTLSSPYQVGVAMHNNVICVLSNSTNYGSYLMAVGFTVSGTTITGNSGVTYASGNIGAGTNYQNYLMADPTNSGKFFAAYSEEANNYPYAMMIDTNGSSISVSKQRVTTSLTGTSDKCHIAYSPYHNRFMGLWTKGGNYTVVCDFYFNGSALTVGTPLYQDLDQDSDHFGIGYDSTTQNYFYISRSGGTLYGWQVNTNSSGGATSFSGTSTIRSGYSGDYWACHTYDNSTNTSQVGVLAFEGSGNTKLLLLTGDTAGNIVIKNQIFLGDKVESTSSGCLNGLHGRNTFLGLQSYIQGSGITRLTKASEINTASTYFNALGISEGNYTNGQTATVTVTGGTTTQISGLIAGQYYGPSDTSAGDVAVSSTGNFAVATKTNELLVR